MKAPHPSLTGFCLVAAALLMVGGLCGCGPSAPVPQAGLAQTATNLAANLKSNLVPVQSLKTNEASGKENRSVFEDNLKDARDPFFPKATGTETKPVGAVAAVAKPSAESLLELTSVVGSAKMRLASINGRTFLAGEEKTVTTASGPVRVRCLEVGAQSVTVEVNGRPEHRILNLSKKTN